MANSKADNRRAALLTQLGVSGVGKTNTDLERASLIAAAGLTETTAARLSIADLGYRENSGVGVTPPAAPLTVVNWATDLSVNALTLNNPSVGPAWQVHSGTWGSDANGGRIVSTANNAFLTSESGVGTNYTLKIKIGNSAFDLGPHFGRGVGTSFFYGNFNDGGQEFKIRYEDPGVFGEQIWAGASPAAGVEVAIKRAGSSFKIFYDSVEIGSFTDARNLGSKHGLYGSGANISTGRVTALSILDA